MSSCRLSVLCVTRFEKHALPFIADMRQLADDCEGELVLAADGSYAFAGLRALGYEPHRVASDGYIESVLDDAITYCRGDYVLRLDDDERCSPAMIRWMVSGAWQAKSIWKFARAHLWGDERHFIANIPQLYPDHQTRLSVREFAGGRKQIHSGSPFGGGELAPVILEHHKFLVKTLVERRAIVARYDRIQSGAGTQFKAFSVPEDVCDEITAAELGDGSILEAEAA